MTFETGLRALPESETRVHDLEAERTRLALLVQDLEQQLRARKAPRALSADPTVLSFFQDPTVAAPVVSGAVPGAVRTRVTRETAPLARSAGRAARRRVHRRPAGPRLHGDARGVATEHAEAGAPNSMWPTG